MPAQERQLAQRFLRGGNGMDFGGSGIGSGVRSAECGEHFVSDWMSDAVVMGETAGITGEMEALGHWEV
jgi:hypothetical protein